MQQAGRRSGRTVAGAEATSARLDLDRYVPALLAFLANKLAKTASTSYQRRFKVNVTEWRILSLLALEPGLVAARICHVIGFDKGPVSRTLAQMERRGLVRSEDDPDDLRRRLIHLTPAGADLHDRILPLALEREQRLLSCLSPAQRETLIGLLNALNANLTAVDDARGAAGRHGAERLHARPRSAERRGG